MSSESFTYKGISAGKYIEGEIEAISQEEANYKLKEQKIIITNFHSKLYDLILIQEKEKQFRQVLKIQMENMFCFKMQI